MKNPALPVLALAVLSAVPAFTAPVPAWTPNPALASRLAPPVTMSDFQVQPPKQYTDQVIHNGVTTGYLWEGPSEADGELPCMLLTEVAKESAARPLSKLFAIALSTQSGDCTSWKASPPQTGTIHGVLFERCHWTGVSKDSHEKEQGFEYVGQHAGMAFDFSASGGMMPEDKVVFALAEASMLTFRLK